MDHQIFKFKDYRSFLNQKLAEAPQQGRGTRNRWATIMGCQLSFVSHVLNGRNDLSLEQADSMAKHFKLSKEEKEYFFLLVLQDRAGTKDLKKFYTDLAKEKSDSYYHGYGSLKYKNDLSVEDQAVFYSHWIYAAVHVILLIPTYQKSLEKIADYFKMPLEKITEVISFLESRKLISFKGGKYLVNENWLFLNSSSPFRLQYLAQWKQKSIQVFSDFQNSNKEHANLLFAATQDDADKIRDLFKTCFAKAAEIAQKQEKQGDSSKLFCMSHELFEVK